MIAMWIEPMDLRENPVEEQSKLASLTRSLIDYTYN